MMLEVEGLRSGYGRTNVLWDLDFHVPAGSITCLLGLNGAGKTTLLKTVMGLLSVTQGDIRYEGNSLNDLATHQIARKGIAYAPQDAALFTDLTVEENLKVAFRTNGNFSEALKRALAPFPVLAERLRQHAGTLSGGEQKMLFLARTLLVSPRLMLLDEITEGVQPTILERIRGTLTGVNQEQETTIFLVEQNVGFALSLADQYLVMKQGVIVEQGPVTAPEDRDRIERLLTT